ncbi:MAG TPA: hypothetical protein VFV99_27800 [Kofleriaceae bacterium]|nr:hypothetical protein [Kofleriaceae bacterium]
MLVLLLVAGLSSTARADDDEPPITFHKGQFGLSARLGLGVRGIATYENTVYCGKLDAQAENGFASVCTGRLPIALDLEGSYGVAQSIELTLDLRVGIESDFGSNQSTDGPHPLQLSPGARFFFSEAKHTKLFVQPGIVFDFADYSQRPGNDFGVRGIEGFWIDLHRSYGFYFWIAETVEFSRWLSFAFEGGIGFQGRYP